MEKYLCFEMIAITYPEQTQKNACNLISKCETLHVFYAGRYTTLNLDEDLVKRRSKDIAGNASIYYANELRSIFSGPIPEKITIRIKLMFLFFDWKREERSRKETDFIELYVNTTTYNVLWMNKKIESVFSEKVKRLYGESMIS